MSKIKDIKKKIMGHPIVLTILGKLIYLYAKLILKTCKWEYINFDKCFETWEKEGSAVIIGWHGRLIMPPLLKPKHLKTSALVSLHKDGLIIASFLKCLGIKVIGGSSSRNSKAAALSLMHSMKNGEAIIIIPDGPLGPSMKMTLSPIYYAKKTGKPIIPIIYSIEGGKILKKSWDNTLIPKPFSKGIYQALGPYYIPEDVSEEDSEEYAQKIEDDMNNALLEIDKRLGLPKVEIGKVNKKKR